MPFTSETAKAAGEKSKKRGPNQKTILWEALGNKFVEDYTQVVTTYLDGLIKEKNYGEFMKEYKDLLSYFQPKLAATQHSGSINTDVTITPKDWIG